MAAAVKAKKDTRKKENVTKKQTGSIEPFEKALDKMHKKGIYLFGDLK